MEAAILPDWISAIATAIGVLIAGGAAWFGLNTYWHQKTSNDVSLALNLFVEINRYWDKIVSGEGNSDYNYGQILAYFEIACALFNRSVLSSNANAILGDHIVEVFSIMQATETGRALIKKCRSSDSTFCELEKFGRMRFPQALKTLAFADSKQ